MLGGSVALTGLRDRPQSVLQRRGIFDSTFMVLAKGDIHDYDNIVITGLLAAFGRGGKLPIFEKRTIIGIFSTGKKKSGFTGFTGIGPDTGGEKEPDFDLFLH